MLQRIKAASKNLKSFAANNLKERAKPLLCLVLAASCIMLSIMFSVRTFNVSDGKNNYTVRTFSSNIESAIKKLDLNDSSFEITNVVSKFLTTNVKISYIFPLTVKVGSDLSTYSVRSGLLCDILSSIGIILDEHDTISRSLDSFVDKESTVEITDVEYVTETTFEAIPFDTTVEYSDKYQASTKKLVTEGKVGTKAVTCSVKYVNGKAVESTVIDEKITEYAVDSKTIIGTAAPSYASNGAVHASAVSSISRLEAPSDLFLDKNGVPVKYSSKKTLRATAYTYTGNNCSTGVAPKPGYVAVDPREIPYGTKMYIVSSDGKYVYGYAIAADTGGFIYGNRTDMDLFLETENDCVQFGRRDIVVYFVD